MADPLSDLAQLSIVATAGVQTTRSLKETAKRYRPRGATLRVLMNEVGDTENVLSALEQLLQAFASQPALDADSPTLLRGPIERLSEICNEFEKAMKQFSKKSKTDPVDWTKMEFMGGDVDQFIDTVAGYKATIAIGLGVLTMQSTRLPRQALEEYDALVKDTSDDLELRLQHIEDKLQGLAASSAPRTSHTDVNLSVERQATEQCLRICEDAKSDFVSLASKDAAHLQAAPQATFEGHLQNKYEAQLLTSQRFDATKRSLVEIIARLREQLDSIPLDSAVGDRSRLKEDIQTSTQCLEANSAIAQERLRLQEELEISKDCLEVCKQAFDQASDPIISDKVTHEAPTIALADLFDVGKTLSKFNSGQLIGSMSDETFLRLSADQYERRFGPATVGETDMDHSNSLPKKRASKMTDGSSQEQARLSSTIAGGIGDGPSKHPYVPEKTRETRPELSRSKENHLVIEENEKAKPTTGDKLEDGNDSADSDILSDSSSLWEARTWGESSATSGRPPDIMRLSMQELSDMVLDHTELAQILEASTSHPSLHPDTVLEEFKRLIGCYYRDLTNLSNASEYKPVIQLLKRSRAVIINEARRLLGLVHNDPLSPDQGVKMSRQAKAEMLYYLWQLTMGIPTKQNTPLPGQTDGTGTHEQTWENDSDDDSSIGGDVYPEISAAIAFLKDGVPMQRFQAAMRRFILNAAWEYDVLRASKSWPLLLLNVVDDLWNWLRLILPEPSIPRGKRRIRWTCACGLRLYDDFDEQIDKGALDELENRLDTNYPARSGHSAGPSMNIVLQALRWGDQYFRLFWSRLRGRMIKGGTLPTHNTSTVTKPDDVSRGSESTELLYLLHCNSIGEYGVKLYQDLIHENLNDRELFKYLNTIYSRARNDKKWLTLRDTTEISLCKFFVDYGSCVSIRKHGQECVQQQTRDCVCLPPRSLVGQEYKCYPTPPDLKVLPPFEKNYLMHHFLNPDHLPPNQDWVYKQLPKRINSPLKPGCSDFIPGWGIYFEDNWNFRKIYLLIVLAALISSLIFGICWSIFKLDVQAAFGITSYWIAVVALGLGFMALRSIDKL